MPRHLLFVVFDTTGEGRVVGVFDAESKARAVAAKNPHYLKVQTCKLNAIVRPAPGRALSVDELLELQAASLEE